MPARTPSRSLAPTLLWIAACVDVSGSTGGFASGGDSSSTGTGTTPVTTTTAASEHDEGPGGDDSSGGAKFDVGGEAGTGADDGGPPPSCKVQGDLDAIGPCENSASADSFDPVVQWTWDGADGRVNSATTPLVGNLTDDNGDGEIDLCDTPDVVMVAYAVEPQTCSQICAQGRIAVIDGATGTTHYELDAPISNMHTPAIGDIDGDGVMEIVAASWDPNNPQTGLLMAWEHDGTLAWSKPLHTGGQLVAAAISLADLDIDGDVEILFGTYVFDHTGELVLSNQQRFAALPTAADLDDDGDLEIIGDGIVWHHDGSTAWDVGHTGLAHPQVANLDDDPEPEVVIVDDAGISIYEHDGTPKLVGLEPTGESSIARPAAIHDFDGDGQAQIAVKTNIYYMVVDLDGSMAWSHAVNESSGMSGGTAFDFLGDGSAEAIYADEHTAYAFDGITGDTVFHTPRTSWTAFEYPTVADVDNDGSAEILVVSNNFQGGADNPSHALQVLRDAEDRWVPARRIWNQHTYHVTNVREDGTIPSPEPKSWHSVNTFRTQAQAEQGVCVPTPAG